MDKEKKQRSKSVAADKKSEDKAKGSKKQEPEERKSRKTKAEEDEGKKKDARSKVISYKFTKILISPGVELPIRVIN